MGARKQTIDQKKLVSKILQASNLIHKSRRTGGANYMLTTPDMAKMFEELEIEQKAKEREETITKLLNKDGENN